MFGTKLTQKCLGKKFNLSFLFVTWDFSPDFLQEYASRKDLFSEFAAFKSVVSVIENLRLRSRSVNFEN